MRTTIKINIASVLYVLFSLVFIVSHILNINPLLANLLIASTGLLSLAYHLATTGKNKANTSLIIMGLFLTVSMLLSAAYNSNADYPEILWIWGYMGIGALIYSNKIPCKTYSIVAYLVIIWLFSCIIFGSEASTILSNVSQNNISAFVLFFVIVCYISNATNNRRQPYIMMALALIICFWTGSRAGVLSLLLLIIGDYIYSFLITKKRKIPELAKKIGVVVIAVILLSNFAGTFMTTYMTKIDRYGNTSIRTEIWAEYLRGATSSVSNLILGVNNNNQYRLLSYYNGNAHNSFLMIHAKFGIISLIMVVALIFKTVKTSITNNKFYIIIMLSAIIARMMFDWIAFPGLYDVFFWYCALFILDKKNMVTRDE